MIISDKHTGSLSHKLRTLFIHIPKNAGTAILRALGLPQDCGHHPWTDFRTVWPRRWYIFQFFYFKFAVVRNPWDRVVSNYLYARMQRSHHHSPDGSTAFGMHPDFDALRDASFEECIELIPKLKHPGWRTQSHWICGPRGKIMMDYLCRYERLAEDFAYVCRKLRIKSELPVVNASEGREKPWQEFYNERTAAAVRHHYADDIERFGYKFQ